MAVNPFSTAIDQWAKALSGMKKADAGRAPISASRTSTASRQVSPGAPDFKYSTPAPYAANSSGVATTSEREMAAATAARRQNQSTLANELGRQSSGYDPYKDADFVNSRSNINDDLMEARSDRIKNADWARDSRASIQQHTQGLGALTHQSNLQELAGGRDFQRQKELAGMSQNQRNAEIEQDYAQQLRLREMDSRERASQRASDADVLSRQNTAQMAMLRSQLEGQGMQGLKRPQLEDSQADVQKYLANLQSQTEKYRVFMGMAKGQDSRYWS
jgi:hypothetical protein